MEVLVRNAEGNLSDKDRQYAAEKLGRLDRFFNRASRVEIVHREMKNGHRVEVTVFADGFTVRGEEMDQNVCAAIDLVSEKLDQRLRRLKRRMSDSYHRRGHHLPPALSEPDAADHDHHAYDLVEHKQFTVKPMSIEEAALQLEMVDHPFFIFKNEDTNRVEVLYRRKDGKYGLLQPEH
ncbi:MAG: ribosome-associated translation inhibitor RaiA [Chthonomonas sp.]|nr:ribosome-associated translation inhibitor RaiA [Chthonomonas sp.]